MEKFKINHLAVWILVVAHQAIAFIWYSPLLFEKKWMELLGKQAEDFAGASPLNYLVAIIAALALTYTMAWLFKALNVDSVWKGLKYALLFGISFYFLELVTQGFFSLRPFGLALIDGGMYLVNFLIAGIVLSTWKKQVE